MKSGAMVLKRHGGLVLVFLLAMLAFSLAASAACESILVEGAGYAASNGTYVHAGEAYGKPTYELGGAYRITWMGKWYLSDFIGGTYYQNDSAASEPPSTGWVSLNPANAPAPTLACADPAPIPEQPTPEPKVVGRSYELQGESLTLVYENVGSGPATVHQLYAGPALCAEGAEDSTSFWIPDSDLWQVIPLDRAHILEPGETLTLVLPMIQLPEGWLQQAIARSALFAGFAFSAPHIAVGAETSPTSWIHLVPAWLEQVQRHGE